MMKRMALFVFFTLLSLSSLLGTQIGHMATGVATEKFLKAKEAVEQSQYGRASTLFQELLEGGFNSSDIHYNLGLVSYREKKIGKSIFHFRTAKQLDPNDADTSFNLAYVRKQRKDKLNSEPGLLDALSEQYPLNRKQTIKTLSILVILFTVASIFALYPPTSTFIIWFRRGSLGMLCFVFVVALCWLSLQDRFGVIVVDEARIFSGKSDRHVHLFSLHEGAEVIVAGVEQDWAKISLQDGRKGWIMVKSILVER